MSELPVTKEVRVLSVLFAVYGWIGALASVVVTALFWSAISTVQADMQTRPSGDEEAAQMMQQTIGLFSAMPAVALVSALALCAVYIGAGWCLKRGKAKWLAYVGAIFALWNVPLGLALAIYTFVVLGKTENQQGFV